MREREIELRMPLLKDICALVEHLLLLQFHQSESCSHISIMNLIMILCLYNEVHNEQFSHGVATAIFPVKEEGLDTFFAANFIYAFRCRVLAAVRVVTLSPTDVRSRRLSFIVQNVQSAPSCAKIFYILAGL